MSSEKEVHCEYCKNKIISYFNKSLKELKYKTVSLQRYKTQPNHSQAITSSFEKILKQETCMGNFCEKCIGLKFGSDFYLKMKNAIETSPNRIHSYYLCTQSGYVDLLVYW